MSDTSTCEVCGAKGKRLRGNICPRGWFYGESIMNDDQVNGEVYVIAVCSMECMAWFFKPGPGKLSEGKHTEYTKGVFEGRIDVR